jgi:uncharacterized protein YdaU (DUF1376 family)
VRKAAPLRIDAEHVLAMTSHLSTEESGAYLRLYLRAHLGSSDVPAGYLPNDEERLRRMSGLSAFRWQKVRSPVLSMFSLTDDEGMYFDVAMVGGIEQRAGLSAKRAEAGRAGGKAKATAPLAIAKQLLSKPVAIAKQLLEGEASAKHLLEPDAENKGVSGEDCEQPKAGSGASALSGNGSSSGLLFSSPIREEEEEEGKGEWGKGSPAGLRGEFLVDFGLWKATLPSGTSVRPTKPRFKRYKARRSDCTREEIQEALQGWKLDPWPDRAQHNDFEVLIRNRAQVEKFSRLFREAQPKEERPRRDGDQHFVTGDRWSSGLGRWVEPSSWQPSGGQQQ